MTSLLTTSEAALFTVLSAWLMSVTGLDQQHVVQGLGNGVPPPAGPFVCMTGISQKVLSSYELAYAPGNNSETISYTVDHVVQLDVYGPLAADMALAISFSFNSEPAATYFEAFAAANGGFTLDPLYADDPVSMPLTNGEQQYEKRYVIKCHTQLDTSLALAMQFMATAKVIPVNVETLH